MQHPEGQSVAPETEAVFRVKATGNNLQFQWQKNRRDLSDGDRFCDTNTDTLHILEVEKSDKGRYRCHIENDLGEEFSKEAVLKVSKLFIVVDDMCFIIPTFFL